MLSPSPMGTCGGSFSLGPSPPVPLAYLPEYPQHNQLFTEGAPMPSCNSDGPPPMSLAELMNKPSMGNNYAPPHMPVSPCGPQQPMSTMGSVGPGGPQQESLSPMPTAGGKIALP